MGMRILIWLGKKLAAVVVIVAITLWLTGLMMTSVIQSVLKEYDIPLQVEPVIYSGVLGFLWGYEQDKGNSVADEANEKLDKEVDSSVSGENSSNRVEEPKTTLEPSTTLETQEQPSVDALAPIELEEELEISKNELGVAKDSLTDEDKVRLMQLMVEKIPTDEWQMISLYMEDGLSETELLETKQILALYLNDEEYRELIGILKKY